MKIMLDPGHGGDDNGAAYGEKYDYLEEDDLNLAVAQLLRYRLMIDGHDVHMSRDRDVAVSLDERCRLANAWGADLFISIHADAWHKETTSGISTHIHPHCTRSTIRAGRAVHDLLTASFPDHVNRGLKSSNFQVLRGTIMPAILVELEFVSNPKTRRFLKEPENQLALARALARGVGEYDREIKKHRRNV